MMSPEWEDRHAAVDEIRRRSREPRALESFPWLFAFLVSEASDLRSKSSRNALLCLGEVLAASPEVPIADEDVLQRPRRPDLCVSRRVLAALE